MSRIITGKLKIEFQSVSFATITEGVVNSLRPALYAKQLHLDVSIDPAAGPILRDPARLQQIVTNLLSNAIKFTANKGRIEVCLQRDDSCVRLKITDTGVGIAAEHLPHIFERFRQVDASNIRAHGGLGLGLAIVDYLVKQQAGTVSAESAGLGQGATFTIEFPLTSLDVRILVVEDDLDTQELLATVLQQHGAEVVAVESAASAVAELARSKPDVIISDIAMAGENGYDLIRKIRSLPPGAGGRVPAIALTAYAAAADRRRALLAGFQTHLAKPIEPDDLLAVVSSLTFQQEPGLSS